MATYVEIELASLLALDGDYHTSEREVNSKDGRNLEKELTQAPLL